MRLPRASMKVPPKRKGNAGAALVYALHVSRLNESPSEKEGKYPVAPITVVPFHQPQ